MNWIGEKAGKLLADHLNEPSGKYETWSTARPDILSRCLQIAQAFQLVAYPILPVIKSETVAGSHYTRECLHIRHHSLFAPRDFDVSPYFEIIKPTITEGFDYKELNWVSDRPVHRPLNLKAVTR